MLWLIWIGCTTLNLDTGETQDLEIVARGGDDQYVEVGQTIVLSAEDVGTHAAEWNLGDGTILHGGTIEHSYTDIGRKRVLLTVTAENGYSEVDSINVVVHSPLPEKQPATSHQLVGTTESIWTIFPEGNSLHRVSLLNPTDTVSSWEVCNKPTSIAQHESTLAVTCSEEQSIALINIESTELTMEFIELPLGYRPYSIIAPQNDGDGWWFTESALDQLGRINFDKSVDFWSIGGDVQGLSRDSDGKLFLPHLRSNIEGGQITIFDSDDTSLSTILLPLDEDGDSDNTTGGTPNLIEQVYPSVDGSVIYAPVTHSNILRGSFVNGQPLTHESTVRGVLRIVDSDSLVENMVSRKHFDEIGRANAVAQSPFGDVLYVLHPGVAEITILDQFSLQILGSLSNLGIFPTDIIQVDDHLYVYAWLTREIIAFDITDPTRPLETWRQTFITEEVLSPEILLGKQIFHNASDRRMTRTGYIACAHCHPNGDQDGQTWDFTDRGEGLRNTSSLMGRAGTEMGRFHWTGNFDEVQDFEGDIRRDFGGSGFLSEEDWDAHQNPLGLAKVGLSSDLDALAEYVSSLYETAVSPNPTSPMGEVAFDDLECGECHPAPLYTDSAIMAPIRHDVGTFDLGSGQRLGMALDGFDTPTLLGVRESGPYLHNGSAESLNEAIRAHDQYRLIDTETLDHIVLFLLSL